MELFVRATVVYWFLWLMVRGTGKRSLAELTPLDMLLIVVLGDVVQQGVTQEDMSVTGALIVVSVFVGCVGHRGADSRVRVRRVDDAQ